MPQRLQVVVDDRLAEAVKALAERDERTVSEWTRLLLDRVVARAESNGALELPGWCVGCGARAGKGELVCQECAALMDAEDAVAQAKDPRDSLDAPRPASGGSRTEPAECQHDDVTTSKTPYGVTTWACRDCPATGSHAR